MPSMTVNELVEDPKFWDLSQDSQLKVMGKVDSRFSNLSSEAKITVLNKLTPKTRFPEPEPEPEKESLTREVARVGGGIVGGVAAGALPDPIVTKPLTIPAGVAIGAAAGDAAYQIAQHAFGDPARPKTSEEAAKAMGWAGVREGTLELAGAGVARVGMKVLAPFKKTVSAETTRLTAWVKDKIKPIVFLPSEATESKFLDVMQNITEGSIAGGMKFEKFKLGRKKILSDMADDVIGMFGPKIGPDEVGDLFVDAISGKNETFKAIASSQYNDIAKQVNFDVIQRPITKEVGTGILAPTGKEVTKTVTEYVEKREGGAWVSTAKLKEFAKPIADEAKELVGIEAANAGDDLIQKVMELPDAIPYSVAQKLRSRFISKADEFSVINKKAPVIGLAKRLANLTDEGISKSLKAYDPEIYEQWRNVNRFYKNQTEQFNSTLIRRLVKMGEENPQAISRAIFKPNNVKTISRIKAALNPKEWESMQSYFIQDIFKQATTEATTDASGKIIESTLMGQRIIDRLVGKHTGIGLKSIKQIFSPEQAKEIFNFANVLKITQKKQAEGLGRMYIQLAQGGAALTVATGGWGLLGAGDISDVSKARLFGAGLIIFGPAVLSRMMLKPTVAKYLTKGINMPASSPQVLGIVTRLIAASRHIHGEMLGESKPSLEKIPKRPKLK